MVDVANRVGTTNLHWADILVLVIYFAIVLAVGIWSSLRANRGSVGGYFLAGRSMHWLLVGASLFASNIGSGHFIGLAGSGAAHGIGIAGFELNAIFILMVLGWLFVPVYIASGVYTMPEYLKLRFGGQRISIYLSFLALLLYIFTKISADLYAGAIFIKASFDLDLYASILVLLVVAAIFTVLGGLAAVLWTDAIQVVIMIIGAFILMIMSFNKVGGYEALVDKYFSAIPSANVSVPGTACGIPPADAMSLMRSAQDGNVPWPGMVFGLTISSIWYWCSDQVIVQRALSAKNFSYAKAGCIMAGWLKFLPLWLIVFPGMAARILFKDEIACTDPAQCKAICGSEQGCTNIAYPMLVVKLMPLGLRGLMLAVMMSALMSSLTSIFNSSSTIFTLDVWKHFRKQASNVELLIVGRVFVAVLVVISILWIPIINSSGSSQLFNYIQAVTSYLAPPVCAVYVLGIFVDRVNEPGAFWGLMMGLLVGMTRFIAEFSYKAPVCGEPDLRPSIITKVHFLHFGILLFFISCVVTLVVSWMTPRIEKQHLHRLTFFTRFSTEPRISLQGDRLKPEVDQPRKEPRAEEMKDHPQPPAWRRVVNFLCGLEDTQTQAQTEAEALQHLSLDEPQRTKTMLDVMAISLMSVAIFFYVFYW